MFTWYWLADLCADEGGHRGGHILAACSFSDSLLRRCPYLLVGTGLGEVPKHVWTNMIHA